MNANPHIGPSGLKPGEFGYEFDCSLADCTYRYHSLSIKDFHPGVLEIVPPAGKVAHLQIGNLIEASTAMLSALKGIAAIYTDGKETSDVPFLGTGSKVRIAEKWGAVLAAIAKAEGR